MTETIEKEIEGFLFKTKVYDGKEFAVFTEDTYLKGKRKIPVSSSKSIPLDEALRLKKSVAETLTKYSGYLNADDRAEFKDFLYKNKPLFKANPYDAMIRAERFIGGNVPPIFSEDYEVQLENGKAYPTLEQLVLIGSGNYNQRLAAKAVQKTRLDSNWGKKSNPEQTLHIPRASLEDVLEFGQKAFDNGVINPVLLRDIAYRLSETRVAENNIENYTQKFEEIGAYLTQVLTPFIPVTRTYEKQYTEGMDLEFVGKKDAWYLDYAPEDREKIVREYMSKTLFSNDSKTDFQKYLRVKSLFPQLFGESTNSDETRKEYVTRNTRLEYSLATRDLKPNEIPSINFKSLSEQEDLREDYLNRVRAYVSSLGNEVLNNVNKIGSLNQGLTSISEIADIVNQRRLEYIQTLGDSEFLSYFPKGVGVFGYKGQCSVATNGLKLHSYVQERYKELRTN